MLEVIVDVPFDRNKPTVFINVVGVLFTTTDARKYIYPENMVEARYDQINRINRMKEAGFQVVVYYRGILPLRQNVFESQFKDYFTQIGGVRYINFTSTDDISKYKQRHKASFLIGIGLLSHTDQDQEFEEEYLRGHYDYEIARSLRVPYYSPKEIFDPFPVVNAPAINPIYLILTWNNMPVEAYFQDVIETLRQKDPDLQISDDFKEAINGKGPYLISYTITRHYVPNIPRERLCILYSYGDYMNRTDRAHGKLEMEVMGLSDYINRVG